MGDIVLALGMLTLAGQQAAEHFFGGFIQGAWMRYVALATTIGIGCLAKFLELPFFPSEWSWPQIMALGFLAGMGANVFHALLPSGANKATVSHLLANRMKHAVEGTTVRPGAHPDLLPPQPPR